MLIGTSFSTEGSVALCPKMITLHTDLPSWEVCMQCMSEIGKKGNENLDSKVSCACHALGRAIARV